MTTIKKLLFVLPVFWVMLAQAQNHEKKCWYIDYEQWNVNTPALHILCGNNPELNPGEELTLEMWVRAYTFGENRKVMGKVDSDGSSFQNGYVMGFQNLNVYTEIWNPSTQVVTYGSAGPIPIDSAFVHMATTYSAATGYVSDYINGVKVGEKQIFPADPITANDAEFMIGAAPWDPYAYQFYGALDEVRVWNVARTEEELQNAMFRELQGDEPGLVAYYNFNTASGTEVPDMSGNGNTGQLQNADDPSWSWASSHAPVGDAPMYAMHEPIAAWSGKTGEEFNYAVTENGFSVIADIGRKEFKKYVVFAHNGNEGVTTENEPAGEHQNFARLSREWYVNQAGFPDASVFVNITEAVGQGAALPQSETKEHYALLYRYSTDEAYRAMAFPTQLYQDNLIFNDVRLQDAYFCVGYSESSFELDLSPVEQIDALRDVRIYPNPATDIFTITNASGAQMAIANVQGQILETTTIETDRFTYDVSSLPSGVYFVSTVNRGTMQTNKLIIKN